MYALRNRIVRAAGSILSGVRTYITPSSFTKSLLAKTGISQSNIAVIPYLIPASPAPREGTGEYVGFAGRLSPEKGINTLLAALATLPEIPALLAGDGPLRSRLAASAPSNATFCGHLGADALATFYRACRFLVVPSAGYETFGIVAGEAMSHGVPVIAARVGPLAEVVEDGITGMLFEPGNADDLSARIQIMWSNPDLCRKLGLAAREKIVRECSERTHFSRLMAVYDVAVRSHPN